MRVLLVSIALGLAALSLLVAAPSSFAEATLVTAYCGNPSSNPNCTATNNYDFDLQKSIVVEHSLNATGQFVWTGHALYGHGFLAGGDPIGGAAHSGDPQVLTSYTDPAGDIDNYLYGLAYDPASNTLFISDTDDARVVAFSRGSFDGAGNSPGAYPVDYTRPGQWPAPVSNGGISTGSNFNQLNGARGIAFNSYTDQLVIADTDNYRVQLIDFTPGDRVSTPPAGGPTLSYGSSIAPIDWSALSTVAPLDVAADPTDGHIFVAVSAQDTVEEFDATGQPFDTISTGLTGPNGIVKAVAVDPTARLLYIAKAGTIEVVSLSTDQLLGTLDIGFTPADGAAITDIDIDPVAHTLYVVTSEPDAFNDGGTPVGGYQLDPPPTCSPRNIKVNPGSEVWITPTCTDVDGGLIEYSPYGSPSAGSVEYTADRSALVYTAPSTPGPATIPFRARSKNGRTGTIEQPVTVADLTPVVRKTANLEPAGGSVQIKLPGSKTWIPLTEATLIPVGTIIDARSGKAHLTFANADGTTQDGIFWDGIFQVSQGKGDKPLVTLKLRDDLVKVPKAKPRLAGGTATTNPFEAYISRRRGKKRNGLWGDAKGKYRTSGKGGSAAVRGTRWFVGDYTYGSLFRVKRGKVLVDPAQGKNFILKAGGQKFIFYPKSKSKTKKK